MLRWIFRKKGNETAPKPAVAAATAVAVAPTPAVDWSAALQQALGDDDALLTLARTAGAPLKTRQAAVEALQSEEALRLAEREFRSHDRRVHQLAKQRLQAKAAQRLAREHAARLIESARSLTGMAQPPANRVVELDRAWRALDTGAIEAAQRDEFVALTARLTAQLRQRADIELQRTRWQADAVAALRQLQAACAEAAAGTQDRPQLAASVDMARRVESALPPGDEAAPAVERALADLQHALRVATALDGQLAVLDRLMAASAETAPRTADDRARPRDAADLPQAEAAGEVAAATGEAGEAAGEAGDAAGDAAGEDAEVAGNSATAAGDAAEPAVDTVADEPAVPPATVDDPQRQWRDLAPLPDAHLAALLQARHARWQQARDQERHSQQSRRREQARESQRARKDEQLNALADSMARVEAALDDGRLADAQRQLSDIDDRSQHPDTPLALRTRIEAAQARLAQLRGWQNWAGGRAREELVLQAEALATATVGAAGSEEGKIDGDDAVAAEVARLSIRQRVDVIETLRRRWKELDGVGRAGGHSLWQRFDAALTTAGQPVVTHFAAQRAAREANLSARRQLLDVLEAVEVGAGTGPVAAAEMADPAEGVASPQLTNESSPGRPGDARELAHALDRFHVEWRKLGPLEHTVPRAASAALVERMVSAVRRLEVPLQAARAKAAAQRQALIMRVRALAGEEPGRGRDFAGEVRALQAEWQQHARSLPLARADEQALWTDFKAAVDAAFAAREAVYNAREAEFESHAAERSALIDRLRVRPEDSAATQHRTLAEVDAAWQRCGPAPRARAAALDAEYRAAREALRRWLDASAQREWQATCDALDAKIAICLARERAPLGPDAQAATASWEALPVLPPSLEKALRRRAGLATADGTGTASDVDALLLSIETAWDLPTPPAFAPARRERKLLALKESLERRRSIAAEAPAPVAALGLLLGRDDLDAGQRERLAAVLAAWRLRGPQRSS